MVFMNEEEPRMGRQMGMGYPGERTSSVAPPGLGPCSEGSHG